MLRYTRDSASIGFGCRGGHSCTCGQKKAGAKLAAADNAPTQRGPMTADRLSELYRQRFGRQAPFATLDGQAGPMTAERLAGLIRLRRQQEARRHG